MSKNKPKPTKQPPVIPPVQLPPPILTKQQKITNLINFTNHNMYQSIQSGDTSIQDVDKIAQSLIQLKQKSILDEIINGHFQVNHQPVPYNISKRKLQNYPHLHPNFQDQLTSKGDIHLSDHSQIQKINATLKQLQESIRRQRQMEKNQSKKLQQKAKQFIHKVQKEKEEFQQKLKNKKSSSRLFVRAYSEDTIQIMKEKLAQRVQQKKEQLAEKLKNIEKRKAQRLQQSVNSQVTYWQKVKQYESCKNLKREQAGDSLLPQIKFPLSSSRSSRYQQDKNHFLKRFLKQEKSKSVLENKFQKIDQYVLKAKLKLHQFQNNSKNQPAKSRLNLLENTNNQNFDDLYISNRSHHSSNQDHSEHRFNLIEKLKHDLQQSKLKIKLQDKKPLKNHSKSSLKIHVELSPLMGSPKQINPQVENLSVNASNLKPSKNPNQSSLEDSWNSVLNKIKFHDITKVQGLAQLSDLEKRLDRYDKQGIVNRLKMKAAVIAEIQKQNPQISVSKVFEDFKSEKESKQVISQQNSLIKGKEKSSNMAQQKIKSLDSSENEFISKQFKSKALGKV